MIVVLMDTSYFSRCLSHIFQIIFYLANYSFLVLMGSFSLLLNSIKKMMTFVSIDAAFRLSLIRFSIISSAKSSFMEVKSAFLFSLSRSVSI